MATLNIFKNILNICCLLFEEFLNFTQLYKKDVKVFSQEFKYFIFIHEFKESFCYSGQIIFILTWKKLDMLIQVLIKTHTHTPFPFHYKLETFLFHFYITNFMVISLNFCTPNIRCVEIFMHVQMEKYFAFVAKSSEFRIQNNLNIFFLFYYYIFLVKCCTFILFI